MASTKPAATPAGAAAVETLTTEALRAALAGGIDPVPVTWGYRLGLLLVALATVTLPAVYLAVVALTGWGVYLHAIHNVWILTDGSVSIGRLIGYLGPMVVGVVVVSFLLKPLLARSTQRRSDIEIGATDHPLLFELVRGVCRVVGAPMPTRVTVDCQVNASASLRRGLASFLGQDLQLTIGLPLVTGLRLRQLAGVLAHEMGHFAQGSGMRLTYLVRSVNAWLARVVYERDHWDQKLEDLSRTTDFRVRVILWVARFGVWASRRLLWMLMTVGHAIGTLMMRQMEYDADRYEARLAGSEVFAATALRMRVLTVGRMKAAATLSAAYAEGRLADDFPTLVASAADGLPAEIRRQVEDPAAVNEKAGVFDTHPPDKARIESAERERAPGLFRLDGPATALLPGFEALARQATESFYRDDQEIDLAGLSLVPTAEILSRAAAAEGEAQARQRYFGKLVSAARPLSLGATPPPAGAAVEEALQVLQRSREVLAQLRAPADQAADKMTSAHANLLAARGAGAVLAAGFRVHRAGVGIDLADASAAQAAASRALEERRSAEEELGPATVALQQRLTAALSLLSAPTVAPKLDDAARRAGEVEVILRALDAMDSQATAIASMWEGHGTVTSLLILETTDDESAQRRYNHVFPQLQALQLALDRLLAPLHAVPYPFEHARGSLSLGAFLSNDMPACANDLAPYVHVEHVLGRLDTLHSRALGRLAVIAEHVEEVALAGLPERRAADQIGS
jgi:Zn-dependent protease with chaperone function